jgi:hypothetical protein
MNKANKTIKMSMARIEYRNINLSVRKNIKYNQKIKNCNDGMRIYSVSIVRIHKQKYNIPPESRTYVA